MAVGAGKVSADGTTQEMDYKEGDTVIFLKVGNLPAIGLKVYVNILHSPPGLISK